MIKGFERYIPCTKEKVEKHKRGKWKKEREENPMESIV